MEQRQVGTGKVILLTGPPASGKSTLRRKLTERLSNLKALDYGQLLIEQKKDEGLVVPYEELRAKSASLITVANVGDLDERVIARVSEMRLHSDVLLDSHSVTRELYGFHAVPYSACQLHRLALDVVIVLRCDPEVILRRMENDRRGRNEVSIELAREHQLLQASIGATNAVICGCPLFVLDTKNLNEDAVCDQALNLLATIHIS